LRYKNLTLTINFFGGIHMRKLLVSLLAVSSTATFAMGNNSEFQEFDNQISIGYGMNSTSANAGTVAAGSGNAYSSSGSQLTLDGERLFNNGVWVNAVANMQFGGGPTSPGVGSGGGTIGTLSLTPYVAPSYGLNAKVGYAFSLVNQHLLLTPYGLVGINNSQNSAVSDVLSATPLNSANSFYYTGGIGGRLEYRINRAIELYVDQNIVYNWDQSQPQFGLAPQDFGSYTSTIGAKFNLAPSFQLGVRGFYTGYQPASGSNAIPGGGALAQATSGYGGVVSLGLTY
jgi:hypothetical protein